MLNNKTYPYTKVFFDYEGKVHFIAHTADGKSSYYNESNVGNGLINFCELDLTEYTEKLKEVKKESQDLKSYDKIRNLIFDTAEITKNKHKYLFFYLVSALNNIVDIKFEDEDCLDMILRHIEECIFELESVVKLQEVFKFGVNLCLDKENLTNREMSEKMVGFYYKYPGFNDMVLKTGFSIMPSYKGLLDYEMVKFINDKNITDTKQMLDMMHIDKKGVSLLPYYLIESFEEMLFFEFSEMLKRGAGTKKCKLCGKYFAIFDNRKREYCDRIYKDDKTCREIGAILVYENKMSDEDSPLRKAEREYNKVYSRMNRALDKSTGKKSQSDMTKAEFKSWSKLYSNAKRDYKIGKITGDELLEIIHLD